MTIWINPNLLRPNNKIDKWKPASGNKKVLWGLCPCGEVIYEGDSVGMYSDHAKVVCYTCWISGKFPEFHGDCAGLKLPDAALSQ